MVSINSFTHVGTELTGENEEEAEIQMKIMSANEVHFFP
jgi:hypothetical protein